MMLIFCFSFCL